MKYILLSIILISWRDFSTVPQKIIQTSNQSKPCLKIETESGVEVGISNSCSVCMNGMILWNSGDTTKFFVPAFGPKGFAIVKVPNYPNKGKIAMEWPCK